DTVPEGVVRVALSELDAVRSRTGLERVALGLERRLARALHRGGACHVDEPLGGRLVRRAADQAPIRAVSCTRRGDRKTGDAKKRDREPQSPTQPFLPIRSVSVRALPRPPSVVGSWEISKLMSRKLLPLSGREKGPRRSGALSVLQVVLCASC